MYIIYNITYKIYIYCKYHDHVNLVAFSRLSTSCSKSDISCKRSCSRLKKSHSNWRRTVAGDDLTDPVTAGDITESNLGRSFVVT